MAIRPANPVPYAWGYNGSGQIGDGSTTQRDAPVPVLGFPLNGSPAVGSLSAGYAHTLALVLGGTVEAWGDNSDGELGNGTTTPSDVPAAVPGVTSADAVSAGSNFSLALEAGGDVQAWGSNGAGQLGTGSTTSNSCGCLDSPNAVDLSGATAISAGGGQALALLGNGTVDSWGSNNDGQLGNGTVSSGGCSCDPTPAPVTLAGGGTATAVVASDVHSMALVGGKVQAWGANTDGEIGNGATSSTPVSTPVAITMPGSETATAIAAGGEYGFDHSLAMLANGTVAAWGYNADGELGNGTFTTSASNACECDDQPALVPNLTGVVAIAASQFDSYALEGNGSLWAWGRGQGGELGNGGTSPSPVPVEIAQLGTGAEILASGSEGDHMVVLAEEPIPALTSTTISFSPQALDTIGPPQSLTLENIGFGSLQETGTSIGGASLQNPDPDDFIAASDGCAGQSLTYGQTCTVNYRFAPSQPSGTSESALVTVSTTAPGTQPTATLSGTSSGLPTGPTGSTGSTGQTGQTGIGATGPAGIGVTGAAGLAGSSGPLGPTGPAGVAGVAGTAGTGGARGPAGAPGAAGEIELVTCKTTPAKPGTHKASHPKCTAKLVSGSVTFTLTGSPKIVHATLMRGAVVVARGVSGSVGGGSSARPVLRLRVVRRLPGGRYTLVLRERDGARVVTMRRSVTIV